MKLFEIHHGYLFNSAGYKYRPKILWIMRWLMHIDSFLNFGRESIPTTSVMIGRSANIREGLNQSIHLGLYDYNRVVKTDDAVLIWGVDLSLEAAKNILEQLAAQIKYLEAFKK
jgi:hypothetical protein